MVKHLDGGYYPIKTSLKALVITFFVFLPITLLGQLYEGVKGDVNNDGSINVLDIVITVNHTLGTNTLDEQELMRVDCNSFRGNCRGDGTVDILDAVKIADVLIGIDECLEPLIDIDGNVYDIVMIGDQVWMALNLKVTHYSNGDSIPNVTSEREWETLTSGAYLDYDNDTDNVPVYGRLYN